MNNEELKEKIVEIIRYCYVKEKDYGYIFDLHIKERINAIADALIAAGIRDMSDIRALADNVMLSVIAHKAEVSSMEQRAKEAEHRAARAEKALLYACKSILKDRNDTERRVRAYFNAYLERAEKELAEEGKDE